MSNPCIDSIKAVTGVDLRHCWTDIAKVLGSKAGRDMRVTESIHTPLQWFIYHRTYYLNSNGVIGPFPDEEKANAALGIIRLFQASSSSG